MKILHVGDASGVAHILAKFQNRMPECEADMVLRAMGAPHGINAHYGAEEWRRLPMRRSPLWRKGSTSSYTVAARFTDIASRAAKEYDVIHIHTSAEIVAPMRARHPDKKIILHHHGDNLRHMDPAHRETCERHADKVLVSTPDLREYGGHEWLPNPVDTDLFSPRAPARNGRAVYFLIRNEPRSTKLRLLERGSIRLDCDLRDINERPVPYADMPGLLSEYEYYIDIKWLPIGKVMAALSTTGLQALAVGCKVVDHRYEVLDGLPREHEPEAVVSRLREYYES